MTNKDKVIAAFLVSAGLFSALQAVEYISTLTMKDKAALMSVAKDTSKRILVASGAEIFQQDDEAKRTA